MKPVKIIIWGFGAMGSGMADMLLDKKGVEITGVCDTHPARAGKGILELLGRTDSGHDEVQLESDIEKVLSTDADLVLLATDSFTDKAYEKIIMIVNKGMNVITTAEEMAYPAASQPELAVKMNDAARKNGVSILGTGINPGYIMDLMVVILTGACRNVTGIEAERINSLSPFGPAVMEEQGVGFTQDKFNKEMKEGKLAGHVGFNESVAMICEALGWKLDKPVRQTCTPIVSTVFRKSPYAEVKEGEIAGCRQEGFGTIDGVEKITMIHPQQIEPEREGTDTGDYIRIKGTPDINMQIKPEIPGGIGTIAMCVNMIPHVINARPGLKTMIDLPVPRAIMGDMRHMIE